MIGGLFRLIALSLGAFCIACTGLHSGDPTPVPIDRIINSPAQDLHKRIETLISKLDSDRKEDAESAKQAILALANESREARQLVIQELIRAAPRSYSFQRWEATGSLLGTMKAVEAVDFLIQWLDCDVGISGLGPNRYPAALAMIKIGDEAIPKLAEALEQKRFGIKAIAAEALFGIGGDPAKEVLRKTLRVQKDRMLTARIRDMLRDWSRAGYLKRFLDRTGPVSS